MVKDIYYSFIETADRINFMVLLPQAFGFLAGNDATFETVQSSRIKTIKLYYKHKVATQSIGLVFAHRINYYSKGNEVLCHKMLKYGLKLDRVHTYKDLCLSQMEEKVTWVIEMTTGSPLNCAQFQE